MRLAGDRIQERTLASEIRKCEQHPRGREGFEAIGSGDMAC